MARSPPRSEQRASRQSTGSGAPTALRPVQSVKTGADTRTALIAALELHLTTTTNKHGRPFQRRTVNAYKYAATQLHNWLSAQGISGDFTAVDTATLNRFFRWYYQEHDVPKSQDGKGGYTGGTNTVQ